LPKLILALFAICFVSAATVFFLRLSPAQRFEADLSNLTPQAAIERLAAAEGQGPLDQNLELRLGELSLRAGDILTAQRVFERLGARPRLTGFAEEKLAELAMLEGKLAQAAQHLNKAYRFNPTPKIRKQLGGWYRALRDTMGEFQVLSSVPSAALDPFEASRLVDLLAAATRYDVLERTLASLANQEDGNSAHWRARLIDFLLDAGRPSDAVAQARGWIAMDSDGTVLSTSVAALLARGAVREATTLAVEALARRPKSAHVAILRFVERGYVGVALALEAEWLAELGAPDARAWATIVEVAAGTGNIDGIHTALDYTRGSPMEPATVAAALGQVLRYRGPRALFSERAWITPPVVEQAPLLAAAIAAEAGLQRSLYDALVSAAALPLQDWELKIWLSLAHRLRGTAAWVLLFSKLPPGTSAGGELSRSVAAAHSFVAQ
jgi:tetratricopeptide (TPR) repeat protein